MNKSINVLLTALIRNKKTEASPEFAVNSLSTLYKGNIVAAMQAISIITGMSDMNIAPIELTKTKTLGGHTKFIYRLNKEYDEVVYDIIKLEYLTSDKSLSLLPDTVQEDKQVVNKRKYVYNQPVEPIRDVLDAVGSTRLTMSERYTDEVSDGFIRDYIKGEKEFGAYDEKWKRRTKVLMEEDLANIHKFGGFYVGKTTDGVGRMYDKSAWGIGRGENFRHYLELADKEELNDNGKWALLQYIVAESGYRTEEDLKPTEDEAIAYFNSNYEELKQIEELQHLFELYENGGMTGLLPEVDAQTQGLSILGAMLLRDPVTAYKTGIIGDKRTDLYLDLALGLNSKLSVTAWNRNNCKTALMTKGYGAGYRTIMFGSGNEASFDYDTGEYTIHSGSKRAVPLMATAEEAGITDTKKVWKAYDKTVKGMIEKPISLMEFLSGLQQQLIDLGQETTVFYMPDGLKCEIANVEAIETSIQFVDNQGKMHGIQHFVKEVVPTSTSLAPRLAQAIDAYIARIVVRIMTNLGLPIAINHDGYCTHLNYTKVLQRAYRMATAQVMEEDILTQVVEQLVGKESSHSYVDNFWDPREIKAMGGLLTKEDIMKGKYSLWF